MTTPLDAHERRERRLAWSLLGLAAIAFTAFEVALLPRLTNAHFGDVEFTGWSGPMGTNLLRGLRPYIDFVLPIPPGSFAVLALVQKLQGRALLLQELVLNETIHLVMGWLAYVLARSFTSRKNAVFTAIATLVTIWELSKECAYDHTAQLLAWASLAAGARALVAREGGGGARLWKLAGFFAAFTLAFKQSTALGTVFGWLLGLLYLTAVEVWSSRRECAARYREALVRYGVGVGLGLLATWALLLSLGSTAHAFFQATFVDASRLKGGPLQLFQNLFVYLFVYPAYPTSLSTVALSVWVGARLLRKRSTLHVGDELSREGRMRAWEIAACALMVVGSCVAAIRYLRKNTGGYSLTWVLPIDGLRRSAGFGLVTLAVLFVAHLGRTGEAVRPDLREDRKRAGHVMNAVTLAALASSLMHNTSAPEFRPFYDNNAIIPLAFASLFIVLDRAELPALSLLFLALTLGGGAGDKFYRASTAVTRATAHTHWAGMKLNPHAQVIERAAARARVLAKPDEAVLVLPEDVQLTALIDRPRPPLLGAIVFVDQYSSRLADDDIARLDEHPPKVLVIHPRARQGWQRFFRIWSGKSGAEQVIDHALTKMIPEHYELDSSYPTTFLFEPGMLDVYVRKDGAPGHRSSP